MKHIPLILLLCSCSSLDDLVRAAEECGNGDECKHLWAEADKRAVWEEERKRQINCPPGFVIYKDNRGQSCVSHEDVGRWLGRSY